MRRARIRLAPNQLSMAGRLEVADGRNADADELTLLVHALRYGSALCSFRSQRAGKADFKEICSGVEPNSYFVGFSRNAIVSVRCAGYFPTLDLGARLET